MAIDLLSGIGTALSFGGSLISGMQQRKSFKEMMGVQRWLLQGMQEAAWAANGVPLEKWTTGGTTGSVDFAGMVRDAEAAGFNPSSVLRAGGAQLYAKTFTDTYEKQTGHNAGLAAELLGQVLASGTFAQQAPTGGVGEALAGLGSNLVDLSKTNFQQALQAAYLNGFQKTNVKGAATKAMFSVPSVISAKSAGNIGGRIQLPFGGAISLPQSTKTQVIEDEFGEVASNVYGLIRTWETAQNPKNRKTIASKFGISEEELNVRMQSVKNLIERPGFTNAWNVYKSFTQKSSPGSMFGITVSPSPFLN